MRLGIFRFSSKLWLRRNGLTYVNSATRLRLLCSTTASTKETSMAVDLETTAARTSQDFVTLCSSSDERQIFGGYSDRVTPDPISNSEVKPVCADGTARETVWESRTSPDYIFARKSRKRPHHLMRAFLYCLFGNRRVWPSQRGLASKDENVC